MIVYFNTRKKNGVPLASTDPLAENVKLGVKYTVNGVIKTGTFVPNAAQIAGPLNSLPNVSDTLCDWFQPLVFIQIQKTVKNFKAVEVPTTINFNGMVQPISQEKLAILPNVNYSWSYFTVHSCPKLQLKTDDQIIYKGKKYRVQSRSDYSDYGYLEYTVILDYTGSDPNG